MTRRGAGAFALAVALAAAPANAGVEDTIGLDPRDVALGQSFAARTSSPASTYYNPAGLSPGGSTPDADGYAELSLGFVYAHPMVHVERLEGGTIAPAGPVRDTVGAVVGARFDLGHAFGAKGLSMGLSLYLPPDLLAWSIHPDDRVQWLFLSDGTQRIGIHAALAYRVASWLSLGVGARVLFDSEVLTTGRVDRVTSSEDPETGETVFDVETQLGEEVTVYGRAAPTVGVLVTPFEALRFGVSYRGQLNVDDWGWTRIQGAPTVGDLGYVHRFSHYFHPHQITWAVWARPTETLDASVDLTYSAWSEALTTNAAALGPGRFGDTLSPSVGVAYAISPRLSVLAGYRYLPTPFDNFGGPTNLLDCDQHIGSLGGDLDLGELDGWGIAAALRWAGRVAFLPEREERKDPRRFESDAQILRNEGYPGYRYGGVVPGLSIAAEARW